MAAIEPIDRRKFVQAGLGAVVAAGAAGTAQAFVPAVAISPQQRAAWQAAVDRVNKTRQEVDASVDALGEAQAGYFAARAPKRSVLQGVEIRRGETLAAALARGRAEYEEEERNDRQLHERFGIDQAEQRNADATDDFSDALDDMMECPAPDGAAVIHKIELSREFDLDLAPVLVDLRRLFDQT